MDHLMTYLDGSNGETMMKKITSTLMAGSAIVIVLLVMIAFILLVFTAAVYAGLISVWLMVGVFFVLILGLPLLTLWLAHVLAKYWPL